MATYYGTAKNDVFSFSAHKKSDIIYGDGIRDNLAQPGNNTVKAGSAADIIYAGYGRDTVYGGAGDDRITGYGYNGISAGDADVLASRDGGDHLDGGNGNDTIDAGGGNDTILGGAGRDVLYGGSGDDIISGGSGNDIIQSGRGADRLTGGAGQDTFVFAYGFLYEAGCDANDGHDTILDFKSGVDRIDLQGYAVAADALTILDTKDGLILKFSAIYEDAEIKLAGVHHLQPGDILFS